MSRAIKLSKEFKEFEFLVYYKLNRSRKYIYRCLACNYINRGKSYDEVSKILQFSRASIIDWVKSFQEGGIDSLLSIKSGRGRKAKISSDLAAELSESVISLQESKCGGRIIGKDIIGLIKERYDIEYSLSGIYKMLSRINMSWVSGRSIHPKGNIDAQESFKKTSILR